MTIRYTNGSLFDNEYDFCLDWNVTPYKVWTKKDGVYISSLKKVVYLPFFVYFDDIYKSIKTY